MNLHNDDWDWTDWAACRGVNTELFFPVDHDSPAVEQVARAKAICARCPVIDDCLDFALRSPQVHGIWGGETAEERRAGQRYRNSVRRVGNIASAQAAS